MAAGQARGRANALDALVVTHDTSRTGAPKVALQLAQAHRDHGWNTAVAYRWGGAAVADFQAEFRCYSEPAMRTRAAMRRFGPTKDLANTVERWAAARLLSRLQPSVVWCNTTYCSNYAVAAAKLGIPYVLYSHENRSLAEAALRRGQVLGEHRVEGIFHPRHRLVGCATATAAELGELIGPDGDDPLVLNSPVDIDVVTRRAVTTAAETLPDRAYVLGCGVANRTKGIDIFGQAAALDRDRRTATGAAPLAWIWLGKIPDPDVPKQFDAVQFLGEVPNPGPWIDAASALVLTSRTDPFPLVVLEAMALRTPVIASDLDGPREQLDEWGRFVPVGDAGGFVDAVDSLVNNPRIAEDLASRAFHRCHERWDIAIFADRAVEISEATVGDAASAQTTDRARVIAAARTASKRAAVVADSVGAGARTIRAKRQPDASPEQIVVLAYHRVGPGPAAQMRLDLGMFRRQLDHLAEHFEVISLDAAIHRLNGRSTPAPSDRGSTRPRLVLTFDDGTDDFCDAVVDELVNRQLPATLYLATSFVEEQRAWDDGALAPSWAALADAASTGFVDIGAHTHTHQLLDRCSLDVTADEIARSDDLIGEHLGSRPNHFAYPKAVLASPGNEALIAERYRSAAIASTRPNAVGRTNPHRLMRSPIQQSDGFGFFVHKANGGMRFEDDIRRTINRLRYRGRST